MPFFGQLSFLLGHCKNDFVAQIRAGRINKAWQLAGVVSLCEFTWETNKFTKKDALEKPFAPHCLRHQMHLDHCLFYGGQDPLLRIAVVHFTVPETLYLYAKGLK